MRIIKEIRVDTEKTYIIPNKPGKQLSLKIYNEIQNNGSIGKDEAQEGLKLFGDYVEDAKLNPNKHPSIDLLFEIIDKDLSAKVDVIFHPKFKKLSKELTNKFVEIANEFGTPAHVYLEKPIKENIKRLQKAFSWNQGFKEYFAVKATPNPFLLKIFKDLNLGADCSSLPELILAQRAGLNGEEIFFSSNDTPSEEFVKAFELGAVINLDDFSHIDFLEKSLGGKLPEVVCFRFNPGPLRGGNSIIGNPEDSKYGFTKEQLFKGYKILKQRGVKRFGIHTMVASNELNPQYFVDTAIMLFEIVEEVYRELDIKIEFVNLGGGIGIPYKGEDCKVDLEFVGEEIKKVYEEIIEANGLSLKIFMENGRMITGPYGYLLARVRHLKNIYKDYVGLDACMSDLMRPALYGAYHHISVLDKEDKEHEFLYDVTGSLCENNDKFAIDRFLPKVEVGDIVAIHDAGAHGHAMGFNYNGKLRSKELLLREDGSVMTIRREESVDDYFATLNFEELEKFK